MFRAIGRFFRAIGYLITGRIDAARKALSANPAVIQATFDNVIEEKKKRIHQYKEAVAGMIVQEEKKKANLQQLTEDVQRLEKLKEGAAAMARKLVQRHGGDIEKVKGDAEYQKCLSAFNDFASTLAEKEARIDELEEDVETIQASVQGHKVQLETLMRELEKITQEKQETVADMITAKEEKELADMITGISQDRTTEELSELRDMRREAKANARVSREMAGLDTQRSEEEFLQYAEQTVANSEFDALIGLTKETDAPAEEPADRSRLPEG